MKITSLKIGGRTYSVETSSIEEMEPAHTIGQIGLFTGKIHISDFHSRSGQAEILLHEVLHGLLNDSGLDLPQKREEKVVRALSPRLAAFLGDNPAEIRELLRMLK